MAVSSRNTTTILLYSTLVLVIPMVLFPELLGTALVRPSLLNLFIELALYTSILWFMNRDWPAVHLAGAVGICAIYRLMLGAVLGLLISGLHLLDLRASIQLGMSSYLPGIILHAGATPFILMSLLRQSFSRTQKRTGIPPTAMGGASTHHVSTHNPPAQVIRTTETHHPRHDVHHAVVHDASLTSGGAGVNGFDRATRYVGEHSAVHVAAVVDSEGLLVSNFVRGNDDPEMWAPYAVLLMEEHGRLLHHGQWGNPDRIDFTLPQYRIVICREHQFVFMVVADRHGDEMLTIRINQGLDIIRKYSADRYTQKMFMNPERSYVPSA